MVTLIQFLAAYSLWLNIFGTICNLLAFYICCLLRQNTTFVFLAFICITDTITLYYWNLNNFLSVFFEIDLQSLSMYSCRIGYFFQFTSLQISAWQLVKIRTLAVDLNGFLFLSDLFYSQVLMTLDRLLSILNHRWKAYFTPLKAAIVCSTCVLLFIVLNLHVLIVYGEALTVNSTVVIFCHSTGDVFTQWTETWNYVSVSNRLSS